MCLTADGFNRCTRLTYLRTWVVIGATAIFTIAAGDVQNGEMTRCSFPRVFGRPSTSPFEKAEGWSIPFFALSYL